ncbi:hypothetical protein HOLleu_21589 [Holothuria leucospilota]|uniref:Reverse transcriptase RNase H-like domain-containing protein n=1 Tax=Holothuria leucospilota TaxID=206669 RepID=A0A9Q1BXN6_HOLLE|nr:hypothetical protein HOLleu_21589 [Holothuria leucospilota]
MVLSIESQVELSWWLRNIDGAFKSISHGRCHVKLTCDASMSGWGACLREIKASGVWNTKEKKYHINVLELLAIEFGLKSLCRKLFGSHIQVLSDSSTAVAYLNNMGGMKSHVCDALAKRIWLWCIDRKIWISAAHIPGRVNTEADLPSRRVQANIEWTLNKNLFCDIMKLWGQPDIDLFASRNNNQLNKFVSWVPDPSAFAVDAFSLNWGKYYFYAFPPFSLIGRCLCKIEEEKARGIIIVPLWTTQTWYVRVMELLIDPPVVIPVKENTLTLPHYNATHPLCNKLRLLVCHISGNRCDGERFRKGLRKSFCLHGDLPHSASMQSTFPSGLFSVAKDTVIPFSHQFQR